MSAQYKKNHADKLYLVSFFIFLSIVLNSRIDYQDSWILNRIFVPFVIYTIIFIYFFVKETNLYKLIVYSSLHLISLNFIPGLKYEFFYGTAADHAFHYRFIQDILLQNMIPQNRLYSEIPLMHLFLAISAKLISSDVVFVMKYLLPFCFGILPFIFFTISKSISKDYNFLKYSILASTIPTTTYFYQLGGTSFAILLMLFFFLCITKIFTLSKNSMQYSLLVIIFIFGLILSHSYTPLVLSVALTITALFYYLINRKLHSVSLKFIGEKAFSFSFLLVISLVSYWIFKANFFLNKLVEMLYRYTFLFNEIKPAIPSRFFEISIFSKYKVLFVFHVSDIILFILVVISFYHLIKNKKYWINSNLFLFFASYFASIFLIFLVQLITNIGDMEYMRLVTYIIIICPIFVGTTLFLLRRLVSKDFFFISVIIMIFVLSAFQYYPCQPLIPKASVDNSTEDYLVYVNMANSVYQVKAIGFTENKTPIGATIAGDKLTLNQMHGFMNYTRVQNCVLWYSPLVENLGRDMNKDRYNFYVTHKPGKAGIHLEQLEFRTQNLILDMVHTNNLIYNNGESFVLSEMVNMQRYCNVVN